MTTTDTSTGRTGGAPPDGPAPGTRELPRKRRHGGPVKRPLWMLIPGGVLMLLVIVIPFLFAIWFTFLDLNQYTLRRWVSAPFYGLNNLVEAFTQSPLLHSVWLSVAFAVLTTIFTVPIGLAAALATHNSFKGRAVVRSLFLIPYILPGFVVATVWRVMLQPSGVVNSILERVGIDGPLWLSGPNSFWALVFVDIWAAWPFIYLLALAGLQAVTREVHEAATLDGTTWWQKLRYVVLPHLKGSVALACLIATLHHINNFTLPFVLFGLPAPHAVEVLPVLTYQTTFTTFRFGLGAAMALISLVLILIPLLIYLRAVRLDVGEDEGKV